jgi:hypothetical protein
MDERIQMDCSLKHGMDVCKRLSSVSPVKIFYTTA